MLKKVTGFARKLSGRLPQRLKRKRAAFGIDAAIMIGFILAMMLALAIAGPSIIQWFANTLMGGSKGAYSLLLELPIWDPSKPPQKPPEGASIGQWVGYAAHLMQGLLQNMALALLSIVLIIAAMCYVFETFRFMSEGTAMNIILNSVFTLIIIFAVPYIYNGVAAAINYVVGWPDVGGWGQIISSGGEIDALVGAAGGAVLTGGWELVVRFFGSVVLFIICISILTLTVMMGAVRLLLVGAMAAALPLLLMLRLIPPVKHLADSLIETVIGIMFASIIGALLIHFGFLLISSNGAGIGGILGTAIALATLAGAAYMSTMFAGRLGGLFMTMGGMASMASSMATGLTLGGAAMGASTGAGFAAGGLKTARAVAGPIAGKGALLRAAFSKQGLRGALTGAGAGLATAAAQVLPAAVAGRSPGRVMQAATGAISSAVQSAQEAAKRRAGTVAEGLLYNFAANKAPGESAHMGLEWYQNMVEGKSDRQVGEYFAGKMGLEFSNNEKAGREFKKALKDLKDKPVMLDRARRNLERFSMLGANERAETINQVLKRGAVEGYRAKVEGELGKLIYDPELEEQDWMPGYYDRILDNSELGAAGKVAKARIFALSREGFEDRLKSGALDAKVGLSFANRVIGKPNAYKSDYEVGRWAVEKLSVHIPDNDKALTTKLGHETKRLFINLKHRDPRLFDNLERELAKAGNLRGKDPTPELNKLEENKQWLQRLGVGDTVKVSLLPTKPEETSTATPSSTSTQTKASQPSAQGKPSAQRSPSKTASKRPPAKKGRLIAEIHDEAKMEQMLKELEKGEGAG